MFSLYLWEGGNIYHNTVNPVYKGHPRDITRLAFMGRMTIVENLALYIEGTFKIVLTV